MKELEELLTIAWLVVKGDEDHAALREALKRYEAERARRKEALREIVRLGQEIEREGNP